MNYIEEANVTMSDNFHITLVPQNELLAAMRKAILALETLDVMKKALFYGRGIVPDSQSEDIQFHRLHNDPQNGINLLHGVLGIATEAGEMLEALFNALIGGEFDHINLLEEVGDNQWYAAAILRALGKTFEEVQETNIAKLRARFPNKFTEFDANNRNLEVERKILER